MSECAGPGCTHPSHKNEARHEKLARISEALGTLCPPPPFRVSLAFRDLLYRHTRVGRIHQKVDRMTGRDE